jgi:hypothetical protein
MRLQEITESARLVWGGHSCPPKAEGKNAQAGNSRRRILPAICAALLALAPHTTAQRTAHAISPRQAIPHFKSPQGSFAFGRAAYASRFRRSSPYTSLPFPFFTDFFNPEDIYSTGYPVASQPPVILLQAARALAGSADYLGRTENDRTGTDRTDNDRRPTISQPLVIELQNGRYVRVHSTPSNGEPLSPEPVRSNSCPSSRAQRGACVERALLPADASASPPPHDLPPALLVFRDGHSEEVRDYSIADGILYARGDYYTDGYWTKKIALSTLNVVETLQGNTKRNVKFVLPASPNEVITRP